MRSTALTMMQLLVIARRPLPMNAVRRAHSRFRSLWRLGRHRRWIVTKSG